MSNVFSKGSGLLKEKRIKVRPIKLNNQNNDQSETNLEDERKSIQSEINQAYEQLQQTKEQQEAIVKQTNVEINEAKENWKTEKQQYIEQAQDEGFKKGLELGKQESLDQYEHLLSNANQIVDSATKDYHSVVEQSDETILELAIHVAEKIIKKELSEDPKAFVSVVNTAIKEIKDQSNLAIYLHPSNYELVIKQKDEIAHLVDRDINISIYINEELNENSCLIEHPFGQIDASIDTQLQELREILHEISMENSQ